MIIFFACAAAGWWLAYMALDWLAEYERGQDEKMRQICFIQGPHTCGSTAHTDGSGA